MTKPIHPIRKMQQAMIRTAISREAEIIARHVKPLLDALEKGHSPAASHICEDCHLLAKWRAKL